MSVATCFFCAKVLGSVKKLEDHVVADHGVKPAFPCKDPDCKASFYTFERRERHEKAHTLTED